MKVSLEGVGKPLIHDLRFLRTPKGMHSGLCTIMELSRRFGSIEVAKFVHLNCRVIVICTSGSHLIDVQNTNVHPIKERLVLMDSSDSLQHIGIRRCRY